MGSHMFAEANGRRFIMMTDINYLSSNISIALHAKGNNLEKPISN